MKKCIVCYGVRDYEIPTFEKLGKEYDYNLILIRNTTTVFITTFKLYK